MRTISINRSLLASVVGIILIALGCTKKDLAPKASANFTFIVLNTVPPARVEFSNQTTNATSYNWDFGDNTSSTEQNPQHLYTKAGTYVVTLRATGTNGTEQKQYQLTVGARSMLIKSIAVDQAAGVPEIATFFAVIKYDGGGYNLPDFYHIGSETGSRSLAYWSGERFYGVPLQDTLQLNVFYRLPESPNPIPVGFDNGGVYKILPGALTTGSNAHPNIITLQNGSGQQSNKITLKVAWQ